MKVTTTQETQDEAKAKHDRSGEALKRLLEPVKGRILTGRILGGVSGVLSIAPYIALVGLGEVLVRAQRAGVSPDAHEVNTIVRVLLMAFVAQLLTFAVGLAITHFADVALMRILRTKIIDRVSRAPLSWFSETTSGRVRKAVQDDTTSLHTLVAHAPVEITAAVVTPFALLVYAFVVDWRLGLISIGTLPIYFLVQGLFYRGMGAKTAEMDTKLGEVSSTAVEFADGITVVKAFGRTGQAHGRYSRAANAFSDFYLAWVKPMMKGSGIAEAFVSVTVLVCVNLVCGGLLVRAGEVGVADVLATSLIALVLPLTLTTIGNSNYAYQLAGHAAARITELLDTTELATLPDDAAQPPSAPATPAAAATAGADAASGTTESAVSFRQVSFGYGATLALQDIDLELARGSITALVGPSGSGKSTLASLVARFQDPSSGTVLVDGRDVRTLTTEELYSKVSFVLQDPQLLRISLRENIRLARPNADDTEVRAAAEAAHVLAEIEAMPQGLDAVVGEDVELSGGQEQRVAIARALLADTPVLVLDEAMTGTDPDAEAEIQAALDRLVTGRTVLVIAHRPQAVYGVDQLIRLEGGSIVARLSGDQVTDEAVRDVMNESTRAAETRMKELS